MKNYIESEVCAALSKKYDIRISGRTISELKRFPGEGGTPSKGDVGIGSKGKISYLVKHRGYIHTFVNKFKNDLQYSRN